MKKNLHLPNGFKTLLLTLIAYSIVPCKKDITVVDTTTVKPVVDIVIPKIIPKGTENICQKIRIMSLTKSRSKPII
jgi:hypothetical protein